MVDSIGAVGAMGGMHAPRRSKTTYRLSETPKAAKDTVEIGSDVMRLNGIEGGIRLDRVMAVKSEVEAGNYFTAEKFDVALDRAIDQLFGG